MFIVPRKLHIKVGDTPFIKLYLILEPEFAELNVDYVHSVGTGLNIKNYQDQNQISSERSDTIFFLLNSSSSDPWYLQHFDFLDLDPRGKAAKRQPKTVNKNLLLSKPQTGYFNL